MRELCSSPYFGIALSVLAFGIGVKLNEKLKTPVCNPLVIAIVLIVGVLLILKYPMKIIMREERLLICSSLRQLPALQWQSIQNTGTQTVLASDSCRLHGRIFGIYGKCLRTVPVIRTG